MQQTFLMTRIDTMACDKSRRYRAIKIGGGAGARCTANWRVVFLSAESMFNRRSNDDSRGRFVQIERDRERQRNQPVSP